MLSLVYLSYCKHINRNTQHVRAFLYIALSLILASSCAPEAPTIEIIKLTNPSVKGGQSSINDMGNTEMIQSWIEHGRGKDAALVIGKTRKDRFDDFFVVDHGRNFYVNWADFPAVVNYGHHPGRMAIHWREKSGKGTYEYDIMMAISTDGGNNWGEHFKLHNDDTKSEHGFVSMASMKGDNTMLIAWLDGRNTVSSENSNHEHQHKGAMTLRCAEMDVQGNVTNRIELDNRVCECCNTDICFMDNGNPIIVYRDKTDTGVRDILYTIRRDSVWMPPRPVYPEGWYIGGCPVNGPAVASADSTVFVGWYSGKNDTPKVHLSISDDLGFNFSDPIRVDNGAPVGRVDVEAFDGKHAWVSWIEEHPEHEAEILLAKFDHEKKLEEHHLAYTSSSRESGFPILKQKDGNLFISYTKVDSITKPVLKKIKMLNK